MNSTKIMLGFQATKSPFYLHVGKDILRSLNSLTRTTCGYATVHSVLDGSLEDRMESFFLSETCKYLFLVSVITFVGILVTNYLLQISFMQFLMEMDFDGFSIHSSHC